MDVRYKAVIGGVGVLCIAGIWLWVGRDRRTSDGAVAVPAVGTATTTSAQPHDTVTTAPLPLHKKGGVSPAGAGTESVDGSTEPVKTSLPDAMVVTRTLNDLLDDDNTEGILQEARRLSKHPDPDVRGEVAFAFSWVGVQALSDLTAMLGDPDPDVESDVRTFWTDLLSEVDNEMDKAAMLEAAADVFGDTISLDFLDDLVMELSMLEEEVALPRLMETLKRLEDKDRVALVIEAIEDITMPDDPATTKEEVLRQAAHYQTELEAELAAEAAEADADDLPTVEETLTVPYRRTQQP